MQPSAPEIELAAKLGGITNLTHGFIYFSPDATEAYSSVGLSEDQHYFASRAAPLGQVSAEIVIATFFNFSPEIVYPVIPAAWDRASPEDIQSARLRAAALTLRRLCPDLDPDDMDEASELARRMIDGIGFEGKPLAAANLAVVEPEDPVARLWQRITVLREWRGDVHVAALTAAPVTAVEALILHAATEQVPKAALVATRRWSEEAWQSGVDSLVARGLINSDETFTDDGRRFREEMELRTDVACAAMVRALGVQETGRLIDLLKPIRRGLLDGGAFARMGR